MAAIDQLRGPAHAAMAFQRRLRSAAEPWLRDSSSPPPGRRMVISILLGCMMLASCREGVLDPQGPVGQAERVILGDATAIMLAVVIPVIVLALVFAWWFRAGNRRATYRPEWDYSGRIELIIWAIPALVILFLGGIAWFLALLFGVFITALIVFGSMLIMTNLNHNMMSMDELTKLQR
jgi:hypothetical protein